MVQQSIHSKPYRMGSADPIDHGDCYEFPDSVDIKITFDDETVAADSFVYTQSLGNRSHGSLKVLLFNKRGESKLFGSDMLGKIGKLSAAYASEYGALVSIINKIVRFDTYTVTCSTEKPTLYGEYTFCVVEDDK